MKNISDSELMRIYRTLDDLENKCRFSADCWKSMDKFKMDYKQYPYRPFIGENYKRIIFCGINLNSENEYTDAIDLLVEKAINDYLKKGKYKIFKKPKCGEEKAYGGSYFYYYVPLLAFIYKRILEDNIPPNSISIEDDVSWDEVIEGFSYCGLTNIIKCSTSSHDNRSTPSENMYNNCVVNLLEELLLLDYKVLFLFTFFKQYVTDKYFKEFKTVSQGERFRIKSDSKKYIVELEHPQSIQGSREKKFQCYLNSILKLSELQKN